MRKRKRGQRKGDLDNHFAREYKPQIRGRGLVPGRQGVSMKRVIRLHHQRVLWGAAIIGCLTAGSILRKGEASGPVPGQVSNGDVSLVPASLTFAPQPVGTFSAAQVATLTNTGGTGLKISNIGRSGDFYEGNDCPAILPAGASCTLSVRFTPT